MPSLRLESFSIASDFLFPTFACTIPTATPAVIYIISNYPCARARLAHPSIIYIYVHTREIGSRPLVPVTNAPCRNLVRGARERPLDLHNTRRFDTRECPRAGMTRGKIYPLCIHVVGLLDFAGAAEMWKVTYIRVTEKLPAAVWYCAERDAQGSCTCVCASFCSGLVVWWRSWLQIFKWTVMDIEFYSELARYGE